MAAPDELQRIAIPPCLASDRAAMAELVTHAQRHGVEASVYLAVRDDASAPAALVDAARAAYFAVVQQQMEARRALRVVTEVLGAAGVPWLTFKGAALAHTVYPRTDLRSFDDIDVLVPPSHFGDAVGAFERAGHRVVDHNWQSIRAEMPGQLHVVLDTGMVVDLHWNVMNHAHWRVIFPISTDDLFARARSVLIGDITLLTLAPEDTLVHTALHACLSGGDRLLWCTDVAYTARHMTSWPLVIDRAGEWNAALTTATMLVTARQTVGARIPAGVVASLAPMWWRGGVVAANAVAPVARATGAPSVLQVVHRAARGTAAATMRDAWARARRWVARDATTLVPRSVPNDPSDPSSILHATGDEDDRDAYLVAVANAGLRN